MSTVFIWNNNLVPGFSASTRHKVIGHAAIHITDNWVRPDVEQPDEYVSYWPSGEDGAHLHCPECHIEFALHNDQWVVVQADGSFGRPMTDDDYIMDEDTPVGIKCANCNAEICSNDLGRRGRKFDNTGARIAGMTTAIRGEAHINFWHDLVCEEYAPDHIIRIPNGNLRDMTTRWAELRARKPEKTHDPHYKAADKNCSRMASRVIRAGWNTKILGMDLNVRFGNTLRGIWTPLMTKRLALSISGATKITWAQYADEVSGSNALPPTITKNQMLQWMRRASNRGSSEANPRFKFGNGEQSESRERFEVANNADLIFP